jgi:hypothetical protein
MRGSRHALASSAVLLLAAGCASGTRPPPAGPTEPEVTLVFAGAAAQSALVAERLDVPLPETERGGAGKPTDPMDGIQARQVFTRAAAAHGARYVSDLEFHLAVTDEPRDGQSHFDCVVQMQTLPAGTTPPSLPPDAVTSHLSRDQPVRLVRATVAPVCTDVTTSVPAKRPSSESTLPQTQSTVTERRCVAQASPIAVLPYWAYAAWFLPIFYDRDHPPSTGKWQLFVSEPHCVGVTEPLEHSFVRGTIYLAPPTAPR